MKKSMNPVVLEIKAIILKSGYTQNEIVLILDGAAAPPTFPGS